MSPPGKIRELTVASIVGGIAVGAILNMGIVFAGMQIGFTIIGSTVGAILGFGILRGVMRKGSILEVNVFQTVASSVNTVNAGIIFTVPVLFLLDMQADIDYLSMTLACIAGSVLGVVMIIPLRKQIIEFERLRFPTAVGVAAILKSPGAGVEKARLLVFGIAFSIAIKFLTLDWIKFGNKIEESYDVGALLGLPAGLHMVFAVSLLSLGAGYLAGRPGLAVLYGTLLNFWVLAPICAAWQWIPAGASSGDAWAAVQAVDLTGNTEEAYATFGTFITQFRTLTSRHVGIGMILGGAIAGLLVAAPALKAAIASLRTVSVTGRREEVSFGVINAAMFVGLILLLLAAKLSAGDLVGWGTAIVVTLIGGPVALDRRPGRRADDRTHRLVAALRPGPDRDRDHDGHHGDRRRVRDPGGDGRRRDLRRDLDVRRHDRGLQDRLPGRRHAHQAADRADRDLLDRARHRAPHGHRALGGLRLRAGPGGDDVRACRERGAGGPRRVHGARRERDGARLRHPGPGGAPGGRPRGGHQHRAGRRRPGVEVRAPAPRSGSWSRSSCRPAWG